MNDYVIMTDSSCDLPQQTADELGVRVMPLAITTGDGSVYRNYLDGREIPFDEFYSALRRGEHITTSAVNVGEFASAMDGILREGRDILVIAFSSGLSTTCNSAELAARDMEEKYPGRKVIVVDSLCASLGQGLLVYLTARKAAAEGLSLEEAADFAEGIKLRIHHWFTVADLDQLKRGGRVSPAAAVVGNTLGIKPVLHVDDEGHLIPRFKVKGRHASLKKMADMMREHFDPLSPDQAVFISHGDCMDDVDTLVGLIRSETGYTGEVTVNYVGPVIASHSGAGTVALFFVGDARQ
ncbi:MAG: DegV family protein [Eubacteriaceae bacterium]|nr:DegV family protein [Eubacteriaceae bacterium]